METITGEPVAEDDIATWADEGEQGYDLDRRRPRGRQPAGDRSGQVVTMRMDKSLLAVLGERAERDHDSWSTVRGEATRADRAKVHSPARPDGIAPERCHPRAERPIFVRTSPTTAPGSGSSVSASTPQVVRSKVVLCLDSATSC